MRKLKSIFLAAALTLCGAGLCVMNNALVAKAETETAQATVLSDFNCSYSAQKAGGYMAYGSSEIVTYSAAEAAAAGIPEGYTDNVLEVKPIGTANSCGVLLDFSESEIALALIEALEFRVYIGASASNTGNYPQIRIAMPNVANSWVHQINEATPTGAWTTVSVAKNSKFDTMCVNGLLDKFELSVRSNAQVPFYIDSINVKTKSDDGVAPEISYTGEDVVTVNQGAKFALDVTAYDALEERNVPVEYVWEEGVTVAENGAPAEIGEYALTLKATDSFGNTSTKNLTVIVKEVDLEAPVIPLTVTRINAKVGTIPMLKATATDNSGSVDVTCTWSEGALDKAGKLCLGTHTWTVTAVDASGNKTTHVVTVVVEETKADGDFVVNEDELSNTFTVTIDGETLTVKAGFKVAQPADPVKENTAEYLYKFIGWYCGETEWDFSTPITADTEIVSKWEMTKRLYNVTFNGGSRVVVSYGDKIPVDKVPEVSKNSDSQYDYELEGWYVDDVAWDMENDVVTGNMNLVAKFKAVPRDVTVTFDGKNATEYKYGDKIERPEDPVKAGEEGVSYTFIGWYNGDKLWDFDTDVVTDDLDLKAKWETVTNETTDSESEESADEAVGSIVDKVKEMLGGCGGVLGGAFGGLTALGVAIVAAIRKKED